MAEIRILKLREWHVGCTGPVWSSSTEDVVVQGPVQMCDDDWEEDRVIVALADMSDEQFGRWRLMMSITEGLGPEGHEIDLRGYRLDAGKPATVAELDEKDAQKIAEQLTGPVLEMVRRVFTQMIQGIGGFAGSGSAEAYQDYKFSKLREALLGPWVRGSRDDEGQKAK